MLKKLNFITLLISLPILLLISCKSKPIPIPGDTKIQKDNIYIEYLNIANLYFSEEQYDKAISYYELAQKNKQLYWDAYYNLGKCYIYSNKWEQAEKIFNDLLKRDPENISLKESIAYIHAIKGDLDLAIKEYDELIKSNPENADFLVNYIAILLLNEKLDEVEAPFMALCTQFPNNTNIDAFQKQIDIIVENNAKIASKNEKEESDKISQKDENLSDEEIKEKTQAEIEEKIKGDEISE